MGASGPPAFRQSEDTQIMATQIQKHAVPVSDQPGCRFVEVLNDPRDARPYGFRIGGTRPGPTVVVSGHSQIAGEIYERLLELPTLPWVRGSLVLITLDALDLSAIDEELIELIGPVDRTLHLPFPTSDDRDGAVRRGYWSVLKFCARLGMISGRGVNLSN